MNQQPGLKIHFFKMTGTGNDFIVIDNRAGVVASDDCSDFVRLSCRRRQSVGADGVILIENDPEVDFKWRFFNADASEAEMCGNGARCAARFAYINKIVNKRSMAFRTLAGIIRAELQDDMAKVQMTPPHDLRMDINVEAEGRTFVLDFLNTGVPHVVWFVEGEEELEATDVFNWGRALRFHSQFQPAGTNVNFVYVKDSQSLSVRTYERGVEGETLACGTGVIASTLIAAVRGRVASPAEVKTRGGELLKVHFELSRDQFREVFLEGEARIAYEADLWPDTLQP
ncbi:MAG: diaminopimelate epimerase [Acidobacteria bacterium]|nr:diaminopimelate epimerase [Acidobacteriota bacterium]